MVMNALEEQEKEPRAGSQELACNLLVGCKLQTPSITAFLYNEEYSNSDTR